MLWVFWILVKSNTYMLLETFKQSVQLRLEDQFIQNGMNQYNKEKHVLYIVSLEQRLDLKKYLNDLPDLLRKYFTKFRCRNQHLPIEAGVRSQVLRDMRVCKFCKTDIEAEFHYLLCCVNFKEKIYRCKILYKTLTFKNF